MSLADVFRFEEVATLLVDSHLAGLTAITLATKTPYSVMAYLTVGRLKSLSNKAMSIDSANLLPSPGATTLVDTHWVDEHELP